MTERARVSAGHLLPLVRRLDVRVLAPAVALVMLGLAAIASDQPSLLGAQLRWWGVGTVVMLGVLLVPYPKLLAAAYPLYGLSILMLVLVLIPGLGVSRNGGMRWMRLAGVNVQPSELAKVAHVMVLARYIRFRRDHRTFKGLFVPFALTILPMGLILKQPDLGTALMMVPVLFVMLWLAGAKTRHLGVVVLLGAASLPLLYFSALAPYQRRRVDTFLERAVEVVVPVVSATGETDDGSQKTASALRARRSANRADAYQLNESLSSVAGGGVFGQGWRQGRANRMDRVAFSWTDFVFVVHAEEWGFAGVALLLGLEAALLLALAMLAREVKEPAGRLLVVGALVLFGVQACVNLAMTVGLAPITGLPLPFLSYGGSAMVTCWLLLALALNAKAREPVVFSRGDFD